MNNATLLYRISYNNNYDELKLESRSLFFIDRITSSFKNDDDFINHYYNKDEIKDFIKKHNNIKGNIVIDYRKDFNNKETLLPLYNQKDNIVYKDDSYNDKISELEKARKLLFNSKNQLFTKLLFNSKLLKNELNRFVTLEDDEVKFAKTNNVEVALINNRYYISFTSLLKHRINSNKLGLLRNAYQDMLDVFKERIVQKDNNTLYYYNREFRLLIEKYNELINEISVKNLKIKKIKNCNYILLKK